MPVKFSNTILSAEKVIIQRYHGTISLRDVVAATEALWADPAYDKNFNGVSDFTCCTADATPADLKVLNTFMESKPELSAGRWVLLAGDPLITAFGILYTRMARKPAFHVCSTWDAASAYLQIELPRELRDARQN